MNSQIFLNSNFCKQIIDTLDNDKDKRQAFRLANIETEFFIDEIHDDDDLKLSINSVLYYGYSLTNRILKYVYENPNSYKTIKNDYIDRKDITDELDVCVYYELYPIEINSNDDYSDSDDEKKNNVVKKYVYHFDTREHRLNKNYQHNSILLYCIDKDYLTWLDILHYNDIQLSIDLLDYATEKNKLPILKFYHEHGLKWQDKITATACLEGHYDCLVYSHGHGCPIFMNCCYFAAASGHLQCYKYVNEQGNKNNYKDIFALYYAIYNGHVDCVEYIIENKIFDTNDMKLCNYAINGIINKKQGCVECLRYLISKNCPHTNEQKQVLTL